MFCDSKCVIQVSFITSRKS